jgi:hydrogenase-4 component F
VLTTFVGFTTSIFSASYIGHELEIGRLTPPFVRFYHAMYQVLMFAMNLALIANNIGLMWVAIEMATLTTVLMVGIYRTHEALEAAWKYFILGSVGIALALFGTILVYMAARPVVGEGIDAMVWTILVKHADAFDPALLDVALCSCCLAMAPRSDWRRCTPGCRMPMPKARRRSRQCCPACCSMSRSMRCFASRCCWR